MDIPTIPGAVYSIASSSSCDVTDKASGKPLGTATPGSPVTTPAYSDALTLSDPDALYVQIKTFNFALAALGLLGGGESASALPSGYLQAEFLESSGTQHINTAIYPNNETGGKILMCFTSLSVAESAVMACRDEDRFYVSYVSKINGLLTAWGAWKKFSYTPAIYEKLELSLNFQNSRVSTLTHAGGIENIAITNTLPNLTNPICLFALYDNGSIINYSKARIWEAQTTQDGKITRIFNPAIDTTGTPCMFDTVSKQPFYNSGTGQFIVGLNTKQALKLAELAATGGSLTVSLPTGYASAAGVMTALETARAKGWTLTIQTYTPEAAAAAATTFALRRIWVRRTADENGSYVATDGNRWHVEWCVDMLTPDGSTPDAYGYEMFRSQEAAVAYWELTPYVAPESENLLTE